MSLPGIALVSVFSANVLLSYGLGSCEIVRKSSRQGIIGALALGASNFIAVVLLWSLKILLLHPFGLDRLEILLFALVVAPLMKYLSQTASRGGHGTGFFARVDDSTLSCLVFGIALLSARSDYSLFEAMIASLASVAGYLAALVLLEAIRERMDLSELPRPMRGGPAILLSAGLMAMAFSGIDGILISNLVR